MKTKVWKEDFKDLPGLWGACRQAIYSGIERHKNFFIFDSDVYQNAKNFLPCQYKIIADNLKDCGEEGKKLLDMADNLNVNFFPWVQGYENALCFGKEHIIYRSFIERLMATDI